MKLHRLLSSSTRGFAKKSSDSVARAVFGRQSNKLTAGVVGLANVGKSTFFQAITRTELGNPANYPFATIDTEESRVVVDSPILEHYAKLFQSQKKISSTLSIYDIAGLTRDASSGKGMGNKFLSEIRLVDGIYHMVRGFIDDEIIHIEDNKVDPVRDLEIVNDELILKDLEYLESALEQTEKLLKKPHTNNAQVQFAIDTFTKAQDLLYEGKKLSVFEWTSDEVEVLNPVNFLTAKPMVYLLNVSEDEYINGSNKYFPGVRKWVENECPNDRLLMFSASLETKVVAGLATSESSNISAIVNAMRDSLNLISFYTCGPQEARQWTIRKNTSIPEAAGVIHTDLQKTFITAQVYKLEDLQGEAAPLNEAKLKASGRQLRVGKTYVVEDGDVLLIKAAKGNNR